MPEPLLYCRTVSFVYLSYTYPILDALVSALGFPAVAVHTDIQFKLCHISRFSVKKQEYRCIGIPVCRGKILMSFIPVLAV